MAEKNRLTVKIGDKDYTLVSEESREYMLEVADFVDRQMSAVLKQNSRLSTAMVAVLTALNSADEYCKMKRKEDEYIKTVIEYTDKIEALQQEMEELKKKIKD